MACRRVGPYASCVRAGRTFVVALAAGLLSCTRSPPRVELRGVVTDVAGRPVAGAVVAETRTGGFGIGPVVVTGADGSFALTLPKGSVYALTATGDGGTAVFRAPETLDGPRAPVALRLGAPAEGFEVTGRIVAFAPLPADVTVHAAGEQSGAVFVTRADATGRYRLRLPRASSQPYGLGVRALDRYGFPAPSLGASVRATGDQVQDLDVCLPAPVRPELIEGVRQAAAPLSTVEAGHGFDDLAALDPVVADARVVGLGEAAYGTRELLQLKHRLFEYLVKKKGFRAVAFEAGRPEARRVNDYVLHGRGTAAAAVAGLGYASWDTEEVLALVEWMKAYNAESKDDAKLQFLGFDMASTQVAAADVDAYLVEVDPAFARARPEGVGLFARKNADADWVELSDEGRAALRAAAAATVARLDAQRDGYVQATSRERWQTARDDARIIAEWTEVHARRDWIPGSLDFGLRELAMAENVGELLARAGPGEKIALWAHNGDISRDEGPMLSMGRALREKYGAQYAAIGLLFGQGGFQANGAPSSPRGATLQDFALGLPPEPDVTTPMTRADLPLAFVDLGRLHDGAVHDWFATLRPAWSVGAKFVDKGSSSAMRVPARQYCAVAFVAKTTPARTNRTARADR
jgi:erythromycin esterase